MAAADCHELFSSVRKENGNVSQLNVKMAHKFPPNPFRMTFVSEKRSLEDGQTVIKS